MGWAIIKGWHLGKDYPSYFNRPFGCFVHSRLVEQYVRTLDYLFVLGVPEAVSDLTIWSIAKKNTFLGSRFEFAAVVFRYEGICLIFENP